MATNGLPMPQMNAAQQAQMQQVLQQALMLPLLPLVALQQSMQGNGGAPPMVI